jgi:hypothetical protein
MKWRRWIGGGLLVVVGLLLVSAAGLYVSAWYHRWRAEQLFAAVRDLKPGVTTEAEYMNAIQPQVRYAVQAETGDPPVPVAGYLAVGNQPLVVWKMFNHLPNGVAGFISNWSALQWALFDVEGTFRDGKLATLHIGEMQGSGRPYAGFVTIHAGRLESLFPGCVEVFTGYSACRMGGNGIVIYTHVDLDDRATDEEKRRALDFRFDCFTAFRRCTDGRRMLDPIVSDDY